jgi:hypothetical protein
MELIRKLALLVEDHPAGFAPQDLMVDGYTEDQIGYHAYLMVDAGLAVGAITTDMESTGPTCRLINLTSAGHDFADAARNQYIWDEVMGDIRRRGLMSASLDIIKGLLDRAIRKRLDGE